MCGISGIFYNSNASNSQDLQLIYKMLALISHRGRGELGVKNFNNNSIGCCRLPVQTNGGHQPVSNESETVFAVINGEIYNYKDFIHQLKQKHVIQGDCDSLILPHLYEENELLLHQISGMYAFCIYDTVLDEAILKRDSMGIKPLYIFENNLMIAFASEKKAFSCLDNGKISEVMPGEIIRVKNGAIFKRTNAIKLWHRTMPRGSGKGIDYESLKKTISNALIQQLPSEWPVAMLCSGGIDSVILTYLAKKYHKHDVQAYVIGEKDSPDVIAARLACKHIGVKLKEIRITQEKIINAIPKVVYHVESFESNIVRNSILGYLMFQEIRNDGFRVAICGEGADELFTGYGDFRLINSIVDKQKLMTSLLDDLYKTQLQRVDRTSMAFNVETRVPYLDDEVIKFSCSIPIDKKCGHDFGKWLSKTPLRRAFENTQIPSELLLRQKETFSSGAGLGDLSMVGGPLEKIAQKYVSNNELISLQRKYPYIPIKTHEQAFYLLEYLKIFVVPDNYTPPSVAILELSEKNGYGIT